MIEMSELALPLGEVIAFYSYKGGTGRSMLLANVAWQLASLGKRVLVIDWDLEAPGLHRYFRPFLPGDPELERTPGVIDWVSDYWDAAIQNDKVGVTQLVLDAADPRSYVVRLRTDGYLFGGGIDLLGPGKQTKKYANNVANFDWIRLFTEYRGAEFILEAKTILVGPGGYDYVLVDSRTGVSDTSGICTVLLADTLVVCFTYNNQSIVGRVMWQAMRCGRRRNYGAYASAKPVPIIGPFACLACQADTTRPIRSGWSGANHSRGGAFQNRLQPFPFQIRSRRKSIGLTCKFAIRVTSRTRKCWQSA